MAAKAQAPRAVEEEKSNVEDVSIEATRFFRDQTLLLGISNIPAS